MGVALMTLGGGPSHEGSGHRALPANSYLFGKMCRKACPDGINGKSASEFLRTYISTRVELLCETVGSLKGFGFSQTCAEEILRLAKLSDDELRSELGIKVSD